MLSPESASINLELRHGYLGGGGVVNLKKKEPINYESGDSILTKQSTCGYLQNMKELLSVVCSDPLSPHLCTEPVSLDPNQAVSKISPARDFQSFCLFSTMSRTQLVLLSSLKLIKAQAEPLLPTWGLHPALEVTLCPHTWAISRGHKCMHFQTSHQAGTCHSSEAHGDNRQAERAEGEAWPCEEGRGHEVIGD